MAWALRAAGLVDRMHRVVGRTVAWLLVLMVAVGAWNAVARYLARDLGVSLASNALIELQWYLFSATFLLGAPHALRVGAHVRVDVLYGGHSRRGKAWTDVCGGALLLLPFCVFGLLVSWGFAADSIAGGEWSNDPGGLPRWLVKPLVPLAFALLLLQALAEIARGAAALRRSDDVEEPPA